MVRIALFCILSMGVFSGNAFAQVEESDSPGPMEYITLEREPVPLSLDSVKQLIRRPQACVEGKVIVRLMIDENGKYVKHLVLKTPQPMCTEAVEPVLHHLRFTPALMDGQAVKCWVTIPFKFGLE
ncbi:MAG TPA: energy transducer TonB [Bacteroidia bacterium]|nr:energy transducer TonB [Bacteroidia bacterium]